MAHMIKSTGGRIWLGHSSQARSIRVYGWSGTWNIVARTGYVQHRCSPPLLLGCLAGMGVILLAPPVFAICSHGFARLLGLAAWAAVAFAVQPILHRYARTPLRGIALPLIAFFYLGAMFASAVFHHTGRGGGLKNLAYSIR